MIGVFLLLSCAGNAAQSGDFTYVVYPEALNITKYTGSGGNVVIPGTIDGRPVTGIAGYAFAWNFDLRSLTLPDSVTSVADHGVAFCAGLTNLTLGDGITALGGYAFGACTGLRQVSLPRSVTALWDAVFADCTGLMSITVDPLNPQYSDRDGVLMSKDQSILMQYPAGRAGSYSVPDGVTTIAAYGFFGSIRLTSVTVPDGVLYIGDNAFSGCSGMTNITLGTRVRSLGNVVFWDCYALTSVYFAGNAPAVGSSTFHNAEQVTVYHLASTTGWGSSFDERRTALWQPRVQTGDASLGVRTNRFGFNISWASGMAVAVEACTDLANPTWSPVGTNTLTGGSSVFRDSQWANYPARFYRLRSP